MYHILLVDDEPSLLELGKLYLEEDRGFSADCARSGKDALNMITAGHYDAVVSDYQIPKMDGIALLKKVREIDKSLPFILFTDKGREDVVIQALNEGADFYLKKGGKHKSQFAELAHLVRIAIDKRRAEGVLRESEERYRTLIENVPDGVVLHRSGEILYANQALASILHLQDPGMLTGKQVLNYIDPDYRDTIDRGMKHVAETGDPLPLQETVLICDDGTRVAVEIQTILVKFRGEYVRQVIVRDITEHKWAEETLRESEERFRTLAGAALEGIMIHDRGVIRDCNQQFAGLFGYLPEEIIGRNGYDFMMTAESCDAISRWRQNGAKGTIDVIYVKKDGTQFYGENTTTTLLWQGKPHSIVQIHDITERKQAEAQLRKSEKKFRESEDFLKMVIAGAKEGIIVYDRELRITLWNRFMEEMTGIKAADVEGGNPFDLFPFLKEQGIDILMNRALEGIAAESSDFKFFIRSTGKKGWVNGIYSPNYDANGTIIGVIGIVQDITKRKNAETALQKSEERYRTVFETTGTATILIEDDMTISLVNSVFERKSGYRKEEIENKKKWTEFIVKEDLDWMIDQHRIRRTNPENALTHYEFRFISRSGEIRNIDGVIDNIPGTTKSVASLLDITERKQTEKALEQAKRKLNLLNYVTFNDIQNMIFTLSGYQHLAKNKITDTEAKDIIGKEENLLQKISHSLKFAQSYQDLGLKPPRWQNVNQIFLLAISHLDFLSIKHTVTLEDLTIFADPLLEQVFQILANNTLMHGKTATQVTLSYAEGPDSLTLFFEDNGVGIPVNSKDKIFRPDFQKTKSVGLFLAREILDITGITIQETGELGKGARFEITVLKGQYQFTRMDQKLKNYQDIKDQQ